MVVVTRYLQRDLFPAIRAACGPAASCCTKRSRSAQRALGVGPKSADHLLEPGELRGRFDGFEVLFYEEVLGAEAVARIVARDRARRKSD